MTVRRCPLLRLPCGEHAEHSADRPLAGGLPGRWCLARNATCGQFRLAERSRSRRPVCWRLSGSGQRRPLDCLAVYTRQQRRHGKSNRYLRGSYGFECNHESAGTLAFGLSETATWTWDKAAQQRVERHLAEQRNDGVASGVSGSVPMAIRRSVIGPGNKSLRRLAATLRQATGSNRESLRVANATVARKTIIRCRLGSWV